MFSSDDDDDDDDGDIRYLQRAGGSWQTSDERTHAECITDELPGCWLYQDSEQTALQVVIELFPGCCVQYGGNTNRNVVKQKRL